MVTCRSDHGDREHISADKHFLSPSMGQKNTKFPPSEVFNVSMHVLLKAYARAPASYAITNTVHTQLPMTPAVAEVTLMMISRCWFRAIRTSASRSVAPAKLSGQNISASRMSMTNALTAINLSNIILS